MYASQDDEAHPSSQLLYSSESYDGSSEDEDEDKNLTEASVLASDESQVSDQALEEDRRRFPGTDQQWRSLTKKERGLAGAIEREYANNISSHLYNIHHFKLRYRRAPLEEASLLAGSKRRWYQTEESGSLPWLPSQQWTAWPLQPHIVPDQMEIFGSSRAISHEVPASSHGPISMTLDDEIQAVMLRRARDQLRERDWTNPIGNQSAGDAPFETQRDDSRVSRDSLAPSDLQDGDDLFEDGESEDESPAFDDDSVSFSAQPTTFIDIDQERELLAPLSRHVLSQFDQLLIGLHKSRQGHVRNMDVQRKPAHNSEETSIAGTLDTNQQLVDSESEQSEGSRDTDPQSQPFTNPDSKREQSQGLESSVSRGLDRYVLRDWSEVLGIAALVGWSPAVIERAAKRCAGLFQESMTFGERSPQDSFGSTHNQVERSQPLAGHASSINVEHHSGTTAHPPQRQTTSASKLLTYFCPISSCARSVQPFEKRWRWREHLKRAHAIPSDRLDGLEKALVSEPTLAATNASHHVACPLEECSRHQQPYEKMWRLREHLKRTHQWSKDEISRFEQRMPDPASEQESLSRPGN